MAKKNEPIIIASTDRVQQIGEQAHRECCDELLGCAELLPLALSDGRIRLPVNATFPDPPDVVLASDHWKLAIEVTRVTWQRLTQVSAEADKNGPPSLVELDPELLVDRPARRGSGSKEVRRGDYRWIRLPSDTFQSGGSVGDSPETATLDALRTAIAKKKDRLRLYATFSPSVWLFLIDYGYPGVWANLLNRADFRSEVVALCQITGFERIYLYQFSDKTPILLFGNLSLAPIVGELS